MGVTTDDQPGPRIDEEVQFQDRTPDGDPTVDGAVRYVSEDLVLKTPSGLKSLTSGEGGGITEPQHEALRTLAHGLTETHNVQVTRDGNNKVQAVLAEQAGGADIRKLEVLTRTAGKVATYRETQYTADGTTIKRQLDVTVNRSSGRVQSLNVVRTV